MRPREYGEIKPKEITAAFERFGRGYFDGRKSRPSVGVNDIEDGNSLSSRWLIRRHQTPDPRRHQTSTFSNPVDQLGRNRIIMAPSFRHLKPVTMQESVLVRHPHPPLRIPAADFCPARTAVSLVAPSPPPPPRDEPPVHHPRQTMIITRRPIRRHLQPCRSHGSNPTLRNLRVNLYLWERAFPLCSYLPPT